MMKRPRWLELGGKEMAEMRELPSFQLLIEWLEWERERAKETVVAAVATGGDAKLRAGSAITFSLILGSLHTPVALADMDDDDFLDPSRRPNRKDSDAEV